MYIVLYSVSGHAIMRLYIIEGSCFLHTVVTYLYSTVGMDIDGERFNRGRLYILYIIF